MAGYSEKRLYQKLGIKEDTSVLVYGFRGDYQRMVELMEFNVNIVTGGQNLEMVHAFVTSIIELEAVIDKYKPMIAKDGMIWISWPKKSSGIDTDLNENIIRDTAIEKGLVDVKVCAIDDDWSGLKLIYRLRDR